MSKQTQESDGGAIGLMILVGIVVAVISFLAWWALT